MSIGRLFMVAFPLVLTTGAIIAFLVATLSGITHNHMYIFNVDLSNLTLNENTLDALKDKVDINLPGSLSDINIGKRDGSSISASDLGLGRQYDINLWGYCSVQKKSGSDDTKRDCSDGEFDWASKNLRTDVLDDIGKSVSVEIELPEEIDKAIDVFSTVTRYAEIAFICSLVVLGVELVFGIFSTCTRFMSCLTWVIGLAAIIITVVTAGLATAMGAVVVGAIEASAKVYGVRASINTRFLACIWIGVAFTFVASSFWFFTICCCAPNHGSGKRKGTKFRDADDNEKLVPQGGYYPIGNDHEMSGGSYGGGGGAYGGSYGDNYGHSYGGSYGDQFQPTSGHGYSHGPGNTGRTNIGYGAYEPYSHRS